MEIKARSDLPSTGAFIDESGDPEGTLLDDALVLDHEEKISFVIGSEQVGWAVSDGLHGTAVWGAVGNDIADQIEIDNEVEIIPGRAYVLSKEGVRLSSKKAEKGFLGIATDTASLIASNKEDNGLKMTVAVGGFVPAFVDNKYDPGTPLTVGKAGALTKAGLFTRVFSPEKIVAAYYKKSRLSSWSGVSIGSRVLVRIV